MPRPEILLLPLLVLGPSPLSFGDAAAQDARASAGGSASTSLALPDGSSITTAAGGAGAWFTLQDRSGVWTAFCYPPFQPGNPTPTIVCSPWAAVRVFGQQ